MSSHVFIFRNVRNDLEIFLFLWKNIFLVLVGFFCGSLKEDVIALKEKLPSYWIDSPLLTLPSLK